MKRLVALTFLLAAFALAAGPADAAKRFGGGGNLGKQRPAPTQSTQASQPAATTPPAQAAPASPTTSPSTAPAAAPNAPASTPLTPAKPSFMSRWGGLLAGLGIGALLASLFGAQMGPIAGLVLAVLLLVGLAFLAMRLFGARKETQPTPRAQFAGIGANVPGGTATANGERIEPTLTPQRRNITVPGFEVEPFVRVAKTSFIRLQAANDAGDLDDIRDYTTPELYAEIAMQIKERGLAEQKTEVVSLDADVVEAVVEDGYEVASVRFWGLMREEKGANPEPFDEVWHVRKKANDRRAPWLIAGIQQAA